MHVVHYCRQMGGLLYEKSFGQGMKLYDALMEQAKIPVPPGKRCWLYTRADSDGECYPTQGAQLSQMLQYAQEYDIMVTGTSSEVTSGGSMDRTSLNEILTAAQAGKMDVLLVYSIDRLMYNADLFQGVQYTTQLNALGVEIKFMF